jgi:hypothetical protein
MTNTESEILKALVELDQGVKTMRTASPKPDLLPLFQRIDNLALELPPGSDPNLRHYLAKKSYEKARRLLEGRDAENAANEEGRPDSTAETR